MEEYVSFDEIIDYASTLEQTAGNMKNTFEEITTSIDKLPKAWLGRAGTAYYERIQELAKNLTPAYEELIKAILFLGSVAGGYENLSNDAAKKLMAELGYGNSDYDAADGAKAIAIPPVKTIDDNIAIDTEGESVSFSPVLDKESHAIPADAVTKPVIQTPSAPQTREEESVEYETPVETHQEDIVDPLPRPMVNPYSSSESHEDMVTRVAYEVIRGDYGNDQARKDALAAAGYNYDEIQDRVNQILRGE